MARLPFSLFKQGTAEYEVCDAEARSDIGALSSDLANLMKSEEVNISVTFNNSISASANKSVAKTGYTPVGVVGWYQGSGAHVFFSSLFIVNNTLYINARRGNNDNGSGTVEFNIYILYVKNV